MKIRQACFLVALSFMHTSYAGSAEATIRDAFDRIGMNNIVKPVRTSDLISVIEREVNPAVVAEAIAPLAAANILTDFAFERTKRGYGDTTRILFTRAAELGDPVGQMELALELNRRSLPLGVAHWIYESLIRGADEDTAIEEKDRRYTPYLIKEVEKFAPAGFIAVVKDFARWLSSKTGGGAAGGAGGFSGSSSESGDSAAAAGGGAGGDYVAAGVSGWERKLVNSFLEHAGYMDRGFTYYPTVEAVRWGADGTTFNFDDPVFAYCTDLVLERDSTVFNSEKYALTPADLDNLVNSKTFKRLYGINLDGAGITDAQVEILAAKPAFAGLRQISLNNNGLGKGAATALATSKIIGTRAEGGLSMSERHGKSAVGLRYSLDGNRLTKDDIMLFLTPEPLPLTVQLFHPASAKTAAAPIEAIRIIAELCVRDQVRPLPFSEMQELRARRNEGDIGYHVRRMEL